MTYFHEEQQFRQWWIWTLLLIAALPVVVVVLIRVAFHFLWPKRRIRVSELRKAEATKYSPLLDYGGRCAARLPRLGVERERRRGSARGDERRLAPHDRYTASERARGRDRTSETGARGPDGQRGALTHVALERDVKGSIPLRLVLGP